MTFLEAVLIGHNVNEPAMAMNPNQYKKNNISFTTHPLCSLFLKYKRVRLPVKSGTTSHFNKV